MIIRQRIVELDVIRAIAIFFVVFGHALCYLHQAPFTLELIYSFHMPVLFTLSGFVAAWSREGTGEGFRVYGWGGRRVGRSAWRLLVPYVFFGAIVLPLVTVIMGHMERVTEIWREFFVLNRGLWYLPACFILICSYVTSEVLGERWNRWVRLAIGVGLAVPVAALYWLTKCDFLRSALSYWFSFYAGVALVRWPAFLTNPRGWIAGAFFVLWLGLALVFATHPHTLVSNLIKPMTGLAILAPLALVAHHAKRIPYLLRVGESTLSIYCIEAAVGSLFFTWLSPSHAGWSALWSLAFVVVVSAGRSVVVGGRN